MHNQRDDTLKEWSKEWVGHNIGRIIGWVVIFFFGVVKGLMATLSILKPGFWLSDVSYTMDIVVLSAIVGWGVFWWVILRPPKQRKLPTLGGGVYISDEKK